MKSGIVFPPALLVIAVVLCACPNEKIGPAEPTPLKPPERVSVTEEPDKLTGTKAEQYTKLLALNANHTEATFNEFVSILNRNASDCAAGEAKLRKLVDEAVKRWSLITREMEELTRGMSEIDYAQVKLGSSRLIADTLTRALDGIKASKPLVMGFKRKCPKQLESVKTQIKRMLAAMEAMQRLKR